MIPEQASDGFNGNLLNTTQMTATLELGVEIRVDNLLGLILRYESGREGNEISIVVTTGQISDLWQPAKGVTYALVLVQGHAYAIATTAHSDTECAFTLLDSDSRRMCEISVVARFRAIGAEIHRLISLGFHVLNHVLLQLKTSMIAAKCHFFHFLIFKVNT